MRILIDINHPAQVHLFRTAIAEWQKRGVEIVVTARNKDITYLLLDGYRIPFVKTGRELKPRLLNLVAGYLSSGFSVLKVAIKFDPDWMIGTSVAIAHVSKLIRAKSIVFAEDSKAANRLFWKLVDPFADYIVTPDVIEDDHGPNHIQYPAYQKLAYLHPERFEPDPSIYAELGLNPGQRYFIIRLVSFGASHDVGQYGLSEIALEKLAAKLKTLGRIFLSSEKPIPPSLAKYRLSLSPTRIHHAMHYATMVVSESATMATEAAILGTPAIYISSLVGSITILDELEKKYKLVLQIKPGDYYELESGITKVIREHEDSVIFKKKLEALLADKIDLTNWIVDLPYKLANSLQTS